jgi:hypothetical protein
MSFSWNVKTGELVLNDPVVRINFEPNISYETTNLDRCYFSPCGTYQADIKDSRLLTIRNLLTGHTFTKQCATEIVFFKWFESKSLLVPENGKVSKKSPRFKNPTFIFLTFCGQVSNQLEGN